MLIPVTEFFKNLPVKLCSECGEVMEEMHECYLPQCEKCTKDESPKVS
ncbi:protein YhfH [Bacillus alkalicellulosilyticus]|nr:protein YhfH [Bacillus alkalicellulosilyticus]